MKLENLIYARPLHCKDYIVELHFKCVFLVYLSDSDGHVAIHAMYMSPTPFLVATLIPFLVA